MNWKVPLIADIVLVIMWRYFVFGQQEGTDLLSIIFIIICCLHPWITVWILSKEK